MNIHAAVHERLSSLLGMSNEMKELCCNSILIHGPPSSGKNKLIQSVSNALEFQVQTMQWTRSWMDSFLNSHVSEKRLVVIDHLDLLFPIGTDIQTDRLTTLLRCFHYIKKQPDTRCVFIGIAVVENLVHPTVRKCFDEYLSIGNITIEEDRLVWSDRPSEIAWRSSPIGAIINQRDRTIQKVVADSKGLEMNIQNTTESPGGLITTVPHVSWDDVIGLEDAKQAIQEMVVWPHTHSQALRRLGVTSPTGVILHGPPGTGKTMLAKAAASATNSRFICVEARHIIKSQFGESEKMIRRIFDEARRMSPCIIFFDEFQAYFTSRSTAGAGGSKLVSQLLLEIDELAGDNRNTESRVTILAATNVLNAVDNAFLQPGRFDRQIHVGLPDSSSRRLLLNKMKKRMNFSEDVDFEQLVNSTEGFCAAEVVSICQKAGIHALQRKDTDEMIHQLDIESVQS